MNKFVEMRRAYVTHTGYEVKAAPAGLPEALAAINWQADWPLPDVASYVVTQDCHWREMFRGDFEACWVFLYKHQAQSVDWALREGGYYILPAPIWDTVQPEVAHAD